jgi:hypothetical protein
MSGSSVHRYTSLPTTESEVDTRVLDSDPPIDPPPSPPPTVVIDIPGASPPPPLQTTDHQSNRNRVRLTFTACLMVALFFYLWGMKPVEDAIDAIVETSCEFNQTSHSSAFCVDISREFSIEQVCRPISCNAIGPADSPMGICCQGTHVLGFYSTGMCQEYRAQVKPRAAHASGAYFRQCKISSPLCTSFAIENGTLPSITSLCLYDTSTGEVVDSFPRIWTIGYAISFLFVLSGLIGAVQVVLCS